jgi:hypothetical protein
VPASVLSSSRSAASAWRTSTVAAKRLVLFGAGAGALGAVVCARRAGGSCGSFDFEKMIARTSL